MQRMRRTFLLGPFAALLWTPVLLTTVSEPGVAQSSSPETTVRKLERFRVAAGLGNFPGVGAGYRYEMDAGFSVEGIIGGGWVEWVEPYRGIGNGDVYPLFALTLGYGLCLRRSWGSPDSVDNGRAGQCEAGAEFRRRSRRRLRSNTPPDRRRQARGSEPTVCRGPA